MRLILLFDAFKVKNFAEVDVRFIGDMDEVGLHKCFWWRGTDLKSFEKRI